MTRPSGDDAKRSFPLPLGLRWSTMRSYGSLLTGQVGRLVFSLGYFLALAAALTLAEFGQFATVSAIGVTLSRVAAFGFVSPLYRTACVRQRLLGAYMAGYLTALAASLPLCIAIAWAVHALVFGDSLSLAVFATILAAEIVCWRTTEVLVIVSNGLDRFMRAALHVIAGTALRAAAALLLLVGETRDLERWSLYYLAANAIVLACALYFLTPRRRLRWTPRVWLARWRDAIGVSAAELLFYAQSELDKILVLALGGPALAGLYAIIMRLADLTAIPVRAMNTLLVQGIMRRRGRGRGWLAWIGLEAFVFALSTLGLVAFVVAFKLSPFDLGANVTLAAGFLPLVLLVPAFRNLIELHAELLYGFERPLERVLLLLGVGLAKATALIVLLGQFETFDDLAWWLNPAFALLYALSASYTYFVVARRTAG